MTRAKQRMFLFYSFASFHKVVGDVTIVSGSNRLIALNLKPFIYTRVNTKLDLGGVPHIKHLCNDLANGVPLIRLLVNAD